MKTKITAIGDVGFRFGSSGTGPRRLKSDFPLVCRTFSRCRALWRLFFLLRSRRRRTGRRPISSRSSKAFCAVPGADANQDGKLSEDEVRQYATKLRGKAKAPPMDTALSAADLRDVKYGPHERNVLDFWFAENTHAASPLIVFIHGGGFVGGTDRGLFARSKIARSTSIARHRCFSNSTPCHMKGLPRPFMSSRRWPR